MARVRQKAEAACAHAPSLNPAGLWACRAPPALRPPLLPSLCPPAGAPACVSVPALQVGSPGPFFWVPDTVLTDSVCFSLSD